MKNMKIVVMATATVMALSACTNDPYGNQTTGGGMNKQTIGTVLGAGGGAVLGSTIGKGKGNIAAIAIGTLLGAGLGNSIGASLDKADMQYYNQASQQALETAPSGQSLPWHNPQSGNGGTITPSSYYQTSNGQYCREYNQTIEVGGRREQGYGTACRQPDGTWRVVN